MVKVIIELEIEGDLQDALDVVDALLENGVPQDEINDHEYPDRGPLHVTSATCRAGE